MDDDLRDFQRVTDRSTDIGSDSDSGRLSPSPQIADESEDSPLERARRAISVLVFGHVNHTRYAIRDRLVVLLKAGAGGVLLAAAAALVFDYSGVDSGPLWQLQFLIRDVIMDGFGIAGELGTQLVNQPLLTILLVLASATLVRRLS